MKKGEKVLLALGALLVAAAGVEHQRAVAQLGQLVGDIIGALDVVLIADIRHQHAHHPAGMRDQPASRLVGRVMVLLEQRANPLACGGIDARLSVDDAGHGAGGNASLPRNVVYGQRECSPSRIHPFTYSPSAPRCQEKPHNPRLPTQRGGAPESLPKRPPPGLCCFAILEADDHAAPLRIEAA